MNLSLKFQGQILKLPYLRNRSANWHGTKGMKSSIHDLDADLCVTMVGWVDDQGEFQLILFEINAM